MAVICRMLELPPDVAGELQANPARLPDAIAAAKARSDVYRCWHGIEHLLTLQEPDSPTARWLSSGKPVSTASGEVPAARLVPVDEVKALDGLIRNIEPEQLAVHYDAAAMDAAGIYPGTWEEWEESFDPLGQLLEHYSFLQSGAHGCAGAGHWWLLVFEELPDGAV